MVERWVYEMAREEYEQEIYGAGGPVDIYVNTVHEVAVSARSEELRAWLNQWRAEVGLPAIEMWKPSASQKASHDTWVFMSKQPKPVPAIYSRPSAWRRFWNFIRW